MKTDQQLLAEAYEKIYLLEDDQVGGDHWGLVGDYNIYVKDVINAADKTVKAVNEPINKFQDPRVDREGNPKKLRTPENAEKYKNTMLAGQWKWTPVYCQFWEGKYDAYDGNHRIAAAIMANELKPDTVTHIPVREVGKIIDLAIQNFNQGKETEVGGIKIRIKKK